MNVLNPHFLVKNPVLTASDVVDMNARYVADPFVVVESGTYYMFFEVFSNNVGHIAYATSNDGLAWTYRHIVLSEGTHFAYPFVFKWNNTWFMVPDKGLYHSGVNLYRADPFPSKWTLDTVLISHGNHIDPTPVFWKGKWYLFTYDGYGHQVNLYYADDLRTNSWNVHPQNPIFTGVSIRPGGRPLITENYFDLFIQDRSSGIYGEKTVVYRIAELSPTKISYSVLNNPIIQGQKNRGWNSRGMHQVDASLVSQQIVLVDGSDEDDNWSIGIYTMD